MFKGKGCGGLYVSKCMRKSPATFICTHCDTEFTSSNDMDAVRVEMDHYRVAHPDVYNKMMNEISLRQLFHWAMLQLRHGSRRRTA
jgi:hypothetical protein